LQPSRTARGNGVQADKHGVKKSPSWFEQVNITADKYGAW